MATAQPNQEQTKPNKLTKDERGMLVLAMDAMIASLARSAAKERNEAVRAIREGDIERATALKYRLTVMDLDL